MKNKKNSKQTGLYKILYRELHQALSAPNFEDYIQSSDIDEKIKEYLTNLYEINRKDGEAQAYRELGRLGLRPLPGRERKTDVLLPKEGFWDKLLSTKKGKMIFSPLLPVDSTTVLPETINVSTAYTTTSTTAGSTSSTSSTSSTATIKTPVPTATTVAPDTTTPTTTPTTSTSTTVPTAPAPTSTLVSTSTTTSTTTTSTSTTVPTTPTTTPATPDIDIKAVEKVLESEARLCEEATTTQGKTDGLLDKTQGILGIVYQWITTMDERTCDICAGRHKKFFTEEDFQRGNPAPPPVHPHCRCRIHIERVKNIV